MRPRSTCRAALAAAAALGFAAAAQQADEERDAAAWEPDAAADTGGELGFGETDPDLADRRRELIRQADDALRQLRQQDPGAAELMSRAYGHAVFEATKGGLLLTGAGGTGVARPHGRDEPTFMRLGSAGIGLGAGFESYRLVLLFRDEEAYESFVSGEWDGQLAAQASAGTQGVSAEEQFLGGIRAFRVTDGGLMAQVDVSAVRFWPARNLNRAAEVEARVAEAARRGVPVGPDETEEARVAAAEPQQAPADEEQDVPDEDAADARQEETPSARAAAQPERLDEIAAERDDLSVFVAAVKAAGLDDTLTGETPYTVFAPTDDAFEAMSGMSREELLAPENRAALIRLLRAHIVADDLDRSMAAGIGEAMTVDGETVRVSVDGERFTVGEADVVESDLSRGNLRVHVVDGVLAAPATQVAVAEEAVDERDAADGDSTAEDETDTDVALRDAPAEPGAASPDSDRPGAASPDDSDRPGAAASDDPDRPGSATRSESGQPGVTRGDGPAEPGANTTGREPAETAPGAAGPSGDNDPEPR